MPPIFSLTLELLGEAADDGDVKAKKIAAVEAQNLNADVLQMLEKLEISKERVIQEVGVNNHNSITATYYLTEKQWKRKQAELKKVAATKSRIREYSERRAVIGAGSQKKTSSVHASGAQTARETPSKKPYPTSAYMESAGQQPVKVTATKAANQSKAKVPRPELDLSSLKNVSGSGGPKGSQTAREGGSGARSAVTTSSRPVFTGTGAAAEAVIAPASARAVAPSIPQAIPGTTNAKGQDSAAETPETTTREVSTDAVTQFRCARMHQ